MRRQEFITLVGGAAGWPLTAHAQKPGRIYRLGDLHLSPRNALNAALFEAVKSDGFIDGQNLMIDERGFGLSVDELPDHAAAIVKAQVDVIIAVGDPPVRAAQRATKTIPISWRRGRYGRIGLCRFACPACGQYDRPQHA